MSPRRCARSTSTTSKDTASRAKRGGEPSPFGPWKTSTGRGPASGPRPARAVCLLGLVEDTFDLEGDRDLLADGDAATGDRAVVADAEVVPVDLAAGREARPGPAEGVRAEAVHLELQRDGPGGAADGELAVEEEVVAVRADAGGPERQRRVRLDLEEVGAADVVVPVGLAGVHRAQVDGGGDAGLQRVRRGDDGPFELVEAAADLAHHHVPDDEGHLGVHGVYRPRPGDVAGNLHGSLGHLSSR